MLGGDGGVAKQPGGNTCGPSGGRNRDGGRLRPVRFLSESGHFLGLGAGCARQQRRHRKVVPLPSDGPGVVETGLVRADVDRVGEPAGRRSDKHTIPCQGRLRAGVPGYGNRRGHDLRGRPEQERREQQNTVQHHDLQAPAAPREGRVLVANINPPFGGILRLSRSDHGPLSQPAGSPALPRVIGRSPRSHPDLCRQGLGLRHPRHRPPYHGSGDGLARPATTWRLEAVDT